MVVHKHTKLTPRQRRALARDHFVGHMRKVDLMAKYGISFPTVQKILARARHGDFTVHRSINRRYEKRYPGELVHLDTKRLPWLKGEGVRFESEREYLFVAIDDYSRELYAGIYYDKSSWSSAHFLRQVLQQCPYTVEEILTDNGTEYKGRPDRHDFVQTCGESGITQRFTQVKRPQTNGKAERVIRTLMEQWYASEHFTSHKQRKLSLVRFVNYYNTAKPHKGIDNATPLERLCEYFYPTKRLYVLPTDAEMHGV